MTPYRYNNVKFILSKNFICIIDICFHQHEGPFPCVRIRCVSVCVKNGSFLTFFDCLLLCVIRVGLHDVSVVPETESLLERFFHALWTLRTANCNLFSIVMVEFFDTEANIARYTHTKMFTFDQNSNNLI